jgi:ribosomal protein L11 methyltransferase
MENMTVLWRLCFQCDPTHAEQLGALLEDYVSAVSWFEIRDNESWMVEAITTSKPDLDKFQELLIPFYATHNIEVPQLIFEEIQDTDWLEATWRNFPPLHIGRYYIYGSHTTPIPPQEAVILEINAATAFGSGEHETTTSCLLTLDDLASEGRKFAKPLDMGCGSGILAMAIAKTWDVPVLAADNDPESVRVTEQNAQQNHCSSLINTVVSDGFEGKEVKENGPYDLIVANILAGPLVSMAPDLSQNLAPKGMVILSGLLSRHQGEVISAYQAQGLRLHSLRTLNDWVALLLEKI